MKKYEYRIITVEAGMMVDEDRLNDVGNEGFGLVSTIIIIDPYSDGSPQFTQFIFEKEKEG